MRTLIYFFLVWCVFVVFLEGPYHTQMTGPLSNVDEAIVLVLLAHLAMRSLMEGRWLVPSTVVDRPLGIVLGLSVLSWLVNGSSLINAIQFLFSVLKPIIIFYWIVTFVRDDSVERWVMGFLVFMILLQIPFILYGLAVHGAEYTGDNVKGAVNTSNTVAILMWLGTLGGLGAYMASRRVFWMAVAGCCLLILALTSTKLVAAFLPIAGLILLRSQSKLSWSRIALLGLVGGGILAYASFRTEAVWMDVESAGKTQIDDYDFVGTVAASEKVQGYYSAIFELPDEIPTFLLGAGPGEYGSYTAMFKRTRLAEKYIMYYDDLFQNTGVLFYRSSGLIAIYGDLGLLALVAWLLMHFRLFSRLAVPAHREDATKAAASTFVVLSSGYLVLWQALFMNVFEGNVFLVNFFWILAGGVVAAQRFARPDSDGIQLASVSSGRQR